MYPIFLEFKEDEGRSWQICLADCPDYMDYRSLADILYSEHLRDLEQTDILVVRPPVDQPMAPDSFNSDMVRPLTKRAPRAALHALFTHDYELKLTDNLNELSIENRLPSEKHQTFLQWLQAAELNFYVMRSKGLFQARPNFVYRAPSRRYVNMFLRVGNVQRDHQVLDAFFFWLVPHLKGRDAILTDTWSISSIALNAARFLERYWAHSAALGSGLRPRICRVDMLPSYPDDLLLLRPEFRDALQRVVENGERNVLVLLSAIATGNSLAQLREAIVQLQARPGEFQFLALYKLCYDCEVPYLCDLSSGVGDMKFTSITRSEVANKTVIDIDPGAYFPLHICETPLLIKKSHAAGAKEFFTRYRLSDALAVHRNAVDTAQQELRHHCIYIDVERLLMQAVFEDKLRSEVYQLEKKPLIIITPPHKAGIMLAEKIAGFVQEKWNESVQVTVHPDLHPTDEIPEKIKMANTDDLLLIVDDVSVTGQRLSRYQQNLRQLAYAGRIVYLVGVARPEQEGDWQRRRAQLAYREKGYKQHTVISIEKVILPDWDHRACPWCIEMRGLTQLVRRGRVSGATESAVLKRVKLLQRASIQRGLVENAIWRPGGSNPVQIGQNSIFVEVDSTPAAEADVIAAVAGALQQMRDVKDDQLRLQATYPHVSVLDTSNYFGDRFNDDVLRVAIIRCAKPVELERWNPGEEEKRREKVREFLLSAANQDMFRLELAVARLARKVPDPQLSGADWEQMDGWPADLWKAFPD